MSKDPDSSPENAPELRETPRAEDLEFPDWSGMAPHDGRMTFEQAVRWNEEILSTFPPKANRAALDADVKCSIEFRLL